MSRFLADFSVPVAVLSVNLLASLLYLTVLRDKERTRTFFTLPVIVQKSFVILFVGPLFISPFLSQPTLPLPPGITVPLGIVLTLEGICMILFSFLTIGLIPSVRKATGLVTSGAYSIVRHPIYSGTLSCFLGLGLLMNAMVSLLYLPVSVCLYYLMTVYEEMGLKEAYPDEYPVYQRKVRARIIPWVL